VFHWQKMQGLIEGERMDSVVVPLITAFSLVFLAELGDKTQLTTIMLSSKASAACVFVGAMLAFFVVDGVSALVGGTLLGFLPYKWVRLGSGLVFIIFGVFSLVRKREEIKKERQEVTLLKTFSMISLMELGDKTQLASIVLAAELGSPLVVLLGVMLAFAVVTGIGVIFGAKVLSLLPERYLEVGASLLFMLFGLIFILSAITDTTLIL